MAFIPIVPTQTSFSSSQCQSISSRPLIIRKRALVRTAPRMSESKEDETVSLSALNKIRSKSKDIDSKLQTTQDVEDEEDLRSDEQKEIDRLRAAEKFITIDEGKYECQACGYVYEPERGDRRVNIEPNTAFEDLPSSFTCPVCRSPRNRFVSVKKVIAGFADNQQYGFGSNTMTGGQKNLLIFGGLALCFMLLLSGYALN